MIKLLFDRVWRMGSFQYVLTQCILKQAHPGQLDIFSEGSITPRHAD